MSPGQEAHRGDELENVTGERQEHSNGHLTVHDQPAPEAERRELGESRDGVQSGGIHRGDSSGAQPGLEELARLAMQRVLFLALLTERLDDADARDRLLDDSGDAALEALVHPVGRKGPATEPHRDEQEGRDRHHHDEREQRGQHHHEDQGDDQQRDVAVRDPELLQEHLDQRQVDRRPGHDVARTHLVAAVRVQVLQMVVDPDLQVALDANRGPSADGAAQVVEYEAGQADAKEDAKPEREGALVRDDRVVEDDRLDVRDQAEQPHRDDGERHPRPDPQSVAPTQHGR
jgi:hypothetical protein